MNVGARITLLFPRSGGVESRRGIFNEELRTLPYAFAAAVRSLQVAVQKTMSATDTSEKVSRGVSIATTAVDI